MMLITPLIVGAICGYLIALIFEKPEHTFRDIILGIIGALCLRIIVFFVIDSHNTTTASGFSFIGLLASIVGGLLLPYSAKFFLPKQVDDNK